MLNPLMLAWAAGFVDGEGCIHIAKQRNPGNRADSYRPGVYIAQNDLRVLEAFCDAVGIRAPIYKVKRASNHTKQCYTLNFNGHSALKLLMALLPYLRRKLCEAEAVIHYWKDGGMGIAGGGKKVDPELSAMREHYYLLLKRLK